MSLREVESKLNMAYGEGDYPVLLYFLDKPMETWTCLSFEQAVELHRKLTEIIEGRRNVA